MPERFTKLLFAALLLICMAGISAAARFIPFSHAEGDFWNNMLDVIAFSHVRGTFLPGFYPYLCASMYRPLGVAGILLLQAGMYVGIIAIVYLAVHRMTGKMEGALIAAGFLALDPDLLSSMPKLWDTEITVLLMMGLFLAGLLLSAKWPWVVALVGIVWGLTLAVRPNALLLALPIAYSIIKAYPGRRLAPALLVPSLALLTLCAANTLAHGSFYLPQNGPYNLFAGANRHTAWALSHYLNAEPSIPSAMADHGYPAKNSYALELRPVYTEFAFQFIAAHPLQWLWLALDKVWTLLRPDTKAHPLASGAGALKLLTSLSVPAWLILLAWSRPWRQQDTYVALFVAAYVLPFVLTNADPRFRVALDVVVLTHAATLVLRHRWGRRFLSVSGRPSAPAVDSAV